jgi:hypothetical protein
MVRFPVRRWRFLLVVFGGLVLLGGAVPALASVTAVAQRGYVPTPQASPISGDVWSKPVPLPSANEPSSIGCGGTGDCAAVGSVSDPHAEYSDSEAFVDNQSNGTWQAPHMLAGLSALDHGDPAYLSRVYCVSPGNCVLTGTYAYPPTADMNDAQAFVANETSGVWGPAEGLPGLFALNTGQVAQVSSMSCTAPGYCTAAGFYYAGAPKEGPTQAVAFSDDEVAGKWQEAKAIPSLGIANQDSYVDAAVSCTSAGNCVIAGGSQVEDYNGTTLTEIDKAFAVQETGYKRSPEQTIKGMSGIDAVDCQSADTCTAVGGDQIATVTKGTWSNPKTVGDKTLSLTAVSCPATGNCLAGGTDGKSAPQYTTYAYTVQEKNGTWQGGSMLPGLNTGINSSYVTSLTCVSAGNCEIGSTDLSTGYINSQIGGDLSSPQQFAGGVSAVSCASSGGCAALSNQLSALSTSQGATYGDYTQKQPIKTATAIALSAAKTTYGHEGAEKISVSVHPEADDPKGKVVIKAGKTTVCVITLSSAKGSCKLTAKQFKPGSYAMTATYTGAPGFRSSVSAATKLIVVKLRTGVTFLAPVSQLSAVERYEIMRPTCL